jgi:hypothetical protein
MDYYTAQKLRRAIWKAWVCRSEPEPAPPPAYVATLPEIEPPAPYAPAPILYPHVSRATRIINAVCARSGITPDEIVSTRRLKHIVKPRQLAIYLCRELTNLSTTQIAHRFNKSDHTIVLHACKKIKKLITEDAEYAAEVAALRAKCEARI